MATTIEFDFECTDPDILDALPMEVLEQQITSFAGRLAAARNDSPATG